MNTRTLSVIAKALLISVASVWISSEGISQDSATAVTKPEVSTGALKAVAAPTKEVPAGVASGGVAVPPTASKDFPGKTDLDNPGMMDPRLLVPVDAEGKTTVSRLSKIDLDADLNYDGAFDNDLPSGQGVREFVPPGLEIGVGEVSRVLVRFKTYQEEFPGDLVVSLELTGINRDSKSGAFEGGSISSDNSNGRIRVWRDQGRKELLLDSGDPAKGRFEWRYDREKRSGGIPRTLYIEGVKLSPKFDGDLRLMVVSSQIADGSAPETPSSLFQTAFDHLLVTVREKPVEKEFINNNVEGVWSNIGTKTPAGGEQAEASVEAQPSR